jgi:iron(III) transport system ATP-binding protein
MLRCIAGLERAHSGEIRIGEGTVYSHPQRVNVPVHERDIGMVFQSYAIWPHMNVFRNVAFPLTVARERPRKAEVERRVMKALELVQLDQLAGRDSTKLSGGQQQRLALARALVREPKLLLLDEPLSNLDAKLREQMRFELRRLQRELGVTTLYVTHDQFEALALSDQIAVMRDGHIEQLGTPREIYESPANHFVANFIGATNFIAGEIVTDSTDATGGCLVRTALGDISCEAGGRPAGGGKVLVAVRPEHTVISSERPAAEVNVFEAEVAEWIYLGESTDYVVRAQNVDLHVRAHPDVSFPRHSNVWLHFPPHRCVILSGETDQPPPPSDGGHTNGP